MSAKAKPTHNETNPTVPTNQDVDFEADVLFQKIFDKWYAFSEKDGECLMAEVTEDEVHRRRIQMRKNWRPAA